MKRSKRILAALAVVPLGAFLVAGQTPKEGATESTIPADTEIHTTESGLQYSVLTPGNGQEFPAFGDVVEVHYTGWLTDGTKFDSSRDRGEPTQFPLGNVIEGWNEGLLLMSPGARFKFTIPANLAYGEAGSPPVIPKNATLIFDVELLRIPERALPYVDWNEERGTTELDGGLKYQVLKAGEGTPAGEAKYVFLEFARYGADKKITLASTMTGMIVGPPSHPKLPFLAPLLKDMQAGTHCLVQVPKALDLQMPGAGDAESTLWQVVVKGALNCEKPSFAMPAEEELTTTASGLKYKVEREGFGKQPTDFNRCTVFYTGWLTDGTQFDSAYDRGQPATFGVTQVIKGWTEGLKLMSEGSKYTFVIPGDLAYGKGGSGAKIPPDATLVFTVELLQVQ